MNPTMMQRFWALIETVRTNMPLALDDGSLRQWLIRQVTVQGTFDTREAAILSDYIDARLPLIRDMAQEH
ncbi:MAG: hypothetical protein HY785_01235 [Oscillatoriophycideae cyanobacterium NC_groundwater_1537_Pr4_S-0.65um_50_18]|jgi:hypothetical protein|nr:hypothetical protein [Oscillatoriophycideae cyanobacterium NC_groundwater_1537_Pr4_S-0.65um_50_18]